MAGKIKKAAMVIACMAMIVTPVWAVTDYSTMTTEELSQIRGTLRDASQEEREAFQAEWQKRMKEMTQGERQQYTRRPENAPMDGSGLQQHNGQGHGWGHGRNR